MADSPALSLETAQFQIPSSSYVEIVDEEVPSYETSQAQQQRQHQHQQQVRQHHQPVLPTAQHRQQASLDDFTVHRSGSTTTLHNRITRNSSVHSLQEMPDQHHRSSLELSKIANAERRDLKRVGLQFLNSRQLFGLAAGRDLSLLAIIRDLYKVLKEWYRLAYVEESLFLRDPAVSSNVVINARSSEYLMAALWCVVSGYFTYQILDSLMVRWIIIYSPSAVIMRMISMSMFIVTIIHLLTKAFNPDGNYYLHVWILISCALTGIYIFQSFVTSNLSIENYNDEQDDGVVTFTKKQKKARFIDLYNIAVFAVVPIGLASFITMIGLIRNLLILKLDVENFLNNYGH